MPIYRKVSGTWKIVVPYRKIGGVWKQCTVYRKIAGVWKLVGGLLTALVTDNNPQGSGTGTTQVVYSSTTTASATGGSGSYSYAWTAIANPDGISIDSASGASTTFSKNMLGGTSASGSFKCTVTDTVSAQTADTENVVVELFNGV